ncbi:MAG: ATP-grasp domain-containing protein [Methanomicrobiales archaeon]|nr:ATP-grasp domain-containing protein [Methanomicrobiales archaeon]
MRVLLAEYTLFHDPVLAAEGAAMLRVLAESFRRCGHDVILPEKGDFTRELERLAPSSDAALVIAPDHLMAEFTQVLEQHTRNLGCGSMVAAVCANKQLTGKILSRHGIDTPAETRTGMKVIKPIHGCGSIGIRISEEAPGEGEMGQELLSGDHLSVSLIGPHVIGEACLYYDPGPPLPLVLNRQDVRIEGGRFHYHGGETPADHPRAREILEVARKTVKVLGCQGYAGVDLVCGDRITVVDVNPRITTSLIGIAAVMREEIADLLIRGSLGELPPQVHLNGRVRFSKEGEVTRI